jgi:hypothetical protein
MRADSESIFGYVMAGIPRRECQRNGPSSGGNQPEKSLRTPQMRRRACDLVYRVKNGHRADIAFISDLSMLLSGRLGPQELTGGPGSRCRGALLDALMRMGHIGESAVERLTVPLP